MTTPPPNNNVGSSRLLGTDDAQRAVDSLTRQVNNLERSVANAARAFQSLANGTNRANRSGGGTNWNANSNFPGNNGGRSSGGGAQFTNTGTLNGQTPNGGAGAGWRGAAAFMMGSGRGNGSGGGAGVTAAQGRLGVAGAVVGGTARGLVNYGNRNMSSNMQMDMFGNYSALAGGIPNGGYQSANNVAMRTTFNNNRIALDANDAARGGYTASYVFGAAQFGGKANQSYISGTRQAAGFAFASPTVGYAGAMAAAQQTYTSRAFYMSQALGLAPTITNGGRQNSMSNLADSMVRRTFQGRGSVTKEELDASLRQGGSLSTNLQFYGQQMGWNQTTIQVYENYIRGMNTAANKGMSRQEWNRLTQIAATGSGDAKKNALAKLKETTGLGASMFERQRDLNATRLTRQERILEHLAPAFEKATDMVNKFSAALTSFLESTGLDAAIGGISGTLTPFSNALGGFGGLGGGLVGGLLGGMLMRGGGGLLGGLMGRFGAGAAGAAGARGLGGMMTATRGAGGAYTITSMGAGAGGALRAGLMRGGLYGAGAYATSELGGSLVDSVSDKGSTGNKWGHVGTNAATGALVGAGIGSFVPVVGTGVGALAGGLIGGGYGIYNQFFGDGNVKKEFRAINSDGINGGADAPVSGGGKGKKGNATGTTGASAAQVIKFAQQQLGDPYVWGGNGPDGWDCSGLLKWAFGQAGVKIPRVAKDQQRVGKAVSTDKVQPGDLLFNGNPAYHVVMAIGGGKIIEAPKPGQKVRIRSFKPGEFTNARRILGTVGNMSDISLDESAEAGTLNEQGSSVGGDIGGGYGGTSELAAIMSALGGGSGGAGNVSTAQSSSGTSTSDSSSSSVTGSNPPGSPKGNIALGKKLAAKAGWTGNQWKALYNLWMRESGWNEKADNPTSDAYGIPQSLPGSKMASAGSDWKTNPETQIKWGLAYIKERYGSPAKAWSFWNSHNPHWYAEGAWSLDQDTTARVHKGEMILPAKQAESVRNAIVNTMTTGTSTGGGGITFAQGAIVVQPSGPMTQQEARMTGKMIVDAITEDKRIKEMQKGH